MLGKKTPEGELKAKSQDITQMFAIYAVYLSRVPYG